MEDRYIRKVNLELEKMNESLEEIASSLSTFVKLVRKMEEDTPKAKEENQSCQDM